MTDLQERAVEVLAESLGASLGIVKVEEVRVAVRDLARAGLHITDLTGEEGDPLEKLRRRLLDVDPSGYMNPSLVVAVEGSEWEIEWTALDPHRNISVTRPSLREAAEVVLAHDDQGLRRLSSRDGVLPSPTENTGITPQWRRDAFAGDPGDLG